MTRRKEVDTLACFPSPGDMELWIARVNLIMKENQADQNGHLTFYTLKNKFFPQKPFFRNMNIQHLPAYLETITP